MRILAGIAGIPNGGIAVRMTKEMNMWSIVAGRTWTRIAMESHVVRMSYIERRIQGNDRPEEKSVGVLAKASAFERERDFSALQLQQPYQGHLRPQKGRVSD